jgi:hypothetical protein
MALPWLQLVQLVPSIVDVSRELLKKNKGPPVNPDVPNTTGQLELRVATLEDNERKQAELVSQMAEQLAVLTKLVVELRTRVFWLGGGALIALLVAVVALFVR